MSENQEESKQSSSEVNRLKRLIDGWLLTSIITGACVTLVYGLVSGIAPVAFERFVGRSALLAPDAAYSHALGMLLAPCIAAGALAMGVFAGFIFGLPRSLTSGEVREIARVRSEAAEAKGSTGDAPAEPKTSEAVGYGVNTNLERISDWLTTIIVGLGLTQLPQLLAAIERFGDRVDLLFGFGGRAFAIGGGLFFLIFGFLFSYISTRTKFLLILTGNDRENAALAKGHGLVVESAVRASKAEAVVLPAPAAPGEPSALAKPVHSPSPSDQIVLATFPLQAKQTLDEMLAVANASARAGDYIRARTLYEEYIRTADAPHDDVTIKNYAGVLGLLGDQTGFDALRKKESDAGYANIDDAEKRFVEGMRSSLQANLYNGRYADSIRIGEMLVEREGVTDEPWVHVWLACAYGQKHAELGRRADRNPLLLDRTAQRVVEEVRRALELDPDLRSYIATLWDPAKIVRSDDKSKEENDLETLLDNPQLKELLADPPQT